jgi:hypothetical protein
MNTVHGLVFSIRVNQASRILFTIEEVEGQRTLLLLEYHHDHKKYEQSKFLRSYGRNKVVNASAQALEITKQCASIEEEVDGQDLQLIQIGLGATDLSSDIIVGHASFSITLNDDQQAAYDLPLPAVIKGVAGSGKTSVAIALLQRHAIQFPDHSLLYITKSRALAREIKEQFFELGLHHIEVMTFDEVCVMYGGYIINAEQRSLYFEQLADNNNIPVEIIIHEYQYITETQPAEYPLSGSQLSAELQRHLWQVYQQSKKYYSYEETLRWLEPYLSRQSLQEHFSPKNIAKEFDLLSALSRDEDYLALGQRQSIFVTPEDRCKILLMYQHWLKVVETRISEHEMRFTDAKRWQFVVADEAQDWNLRSLIAVFTLAENNQIVFCYDHNQSINETLSNHLDYVELLRTYLHKKNSALTLTEHQLSFTYRCPPPIAELATHVRTVINTIIKQQQWPNKGITHQILSAVQSPVMKPISWFNDDENFQQARKILGSHHIFAVITLEQHVETARELFSTPLVFTVEQIKGLEYDFVIAYKLMDDPAYKGISRYLGDTPVRGKTLLDYDTLSIKMNKLLTAFTRSKDTLWVVQPHSTQLKDLLHYLNRKEIPASYWEKMESPITSTQEWIEQVNLFLDRRQSDLAQAVYNERVRLDESYKYMTFESYCASLQRKKLASPCSVTEIQESLLSLKPVIFSQRPQHSVAMVQPRSALKDTHSIDNTLLPLMDNNKKKKKKKAKKLAQDSDHRCAIVEQSDQDIEAICTIIDQSGWAVDVLTRYVTSAERFMDIMRSMPSFNKIFPNTRSQEDHHLKRSFFTFCMQQVTITPKELFSFKANDVPILYHALTSHYGLLLVYEFLDEIPLSTWIISESPEYHEIISATYGDILLGESVLMIVKNKISKMIQETENKQELLAQYMPLLKIIRECRVIIEDLDYINLKKNMIKSISRSEPLVKEHALALCIESDQHENFALLLASDPQLWTSRIKKQSIFSTIITYQSINCLNFLLNHNRENEDEVQYDNDPFGLIRAVSAHAPKILERLLKHQAVDIHFQGKNGNTALHLAVLLDNTKLVQILLSYGADPSLNNENGLNAFEIARSKNNENILSLFHEHHGSLGLKNKKS